VQRQVAYFYTRIASLADHLHALSEATDDLELRKHHARNALAEITNAMNAGDDLLRSLRHHVSRRQPDSITRA
jgi:CRISPR/Cas system CMR-associated protein Cmr5 small subunit